MKELKEKDEMMADWREGSALSGTRSCSSNRLIALVLRWSLH